MKTLKKTFTLLITILFTISCSKSDNSSETPATSNSDYFFNATVDGGTPFQAKGAQVLAGKTISATPRITITSSIAGVGNFQIILDNPVGVSTYNIGTVGYTLKFEHGVAGESTGYSSYSCSGLSGTLNITALSDTEISGTFSFTAKKGGSCGVAAKQITNGSFKSKLIPNS
jgi:hypothetical protein